VSTRKNPGAITFPPEVETDTSPLAEPAGTVTVIEVAVFAMIVAAGPPPNVIAVAFERFSPVIVTVPPTT
jgi:hypothetical protein